MKIYVIIFFFAISITTISCSKYLNVEPKSSVSEDQMFASELGFEQALSGVYSQLGGQKMYGDRLSLGFVSALAQNYAQRNVGAPYYQTKALNFDTDEVRKSLLDIWSSTYNAIAGLNKIIDKTEGNRSVLSSNGYKRIRGEALAMRAYLHFDLFRLFGPEYQTGKSEKAIPYETQIDAYANVPSTSEAFCQFVLEDIKAASQLLKTVDPILFKETEMNMRRIKMNYYAVKGLEARVQMYVGDKQAAASAAQEVVDGAKFPFVGIATVNAAANVKDRLFMPELVFAIRSTSILNWTERYFKAYGGNAGFGLTRTATELNTIYENSATDIRRLYLFQEDNSVLFPSKFWQTYVPLTGESGTSSNRKDQIIPLIRISEMYYILAETAITPAQGAALLNKVIGARAASKLAEGQPITGAFLEAEIQKEYHKEFYGEGQFFFYLKRKNAKRLPFMTVDVPSTIFKLPIPDSEMEYNPTYQ